MHIQSKPSYKISSSVLSCLALCLIASACTTMPSQKSQLESLNYRLDRYADMQKLDQYTSCQAQGMALDQRAQSQADISSYLASARKLSECQSFLEGKTHLIDSKTQMHVRAISILNFIKGGDIAQARSEFDIPRRHIILTSRFYADISYLFRQRVPSRNGKYSAAAEKRTAAYYLLEGVLRCVAIDVFRMPVGGLKRSL